MHPKLHVGVTVKIITAPLIQRYRPVEKQFKAQINFQPVVVVEEWSSNLILSHLLSGCSIANQVVTHVLDDLLAVVVGVSTRVLVGPLQREN